MAFALMALLTLGGCVYSDTITERIIDHDPNSKIDYDLDPILINTPDAEITTDKLPRLDVEEEAEEDDREEDLPEFDEDFEDVQKSAPTASYNPNAASNGTAANAPTTTPSASNNTTSVASNQGSTGDSFTDQGSSDDFSDPDTTSESDTESETETDDEDEVPSEGDGPNEGDEGNGRKPGGTGDFYSDAPNLDDPEIPENINEVVAFGNNAVIVAMLAADSADAVLLGCDAATASKTGDVLAGCGMGNVTPIDFTEGDAMSGGAFSALTSLAPDAVFVTEGKNPFGETELARLQEEKITVYTLPALTSDKRIRTAVEIVGRTLAQGGVSGAEDRYRSYLAFCDDIVSKYSSGNQGLVEGAVTAESGEVLAAPTDVVTLFVDKWDYDAVLHDDSGYLNGSGGVGLATLGFGSDPTNYYLSVGGALNNAASQRVRNHLSGSGYTGVVWQFADETLNFGFGRWSNLDATYDLAAHIGTGGLFGRNLLCYTSSGRYGAGSPTVFPAIIAKTQQIKQAFDSSSAQPGDYYYSYPTIPATSNGTTVGYFIGESSSTFVEACIGLDGGYASVLNDGAATPMTVLVNPKGLCQESSNDSLCSWTDGSVESVLEASWAHYRLHGGSQSDFAADVAYFYRTFYKYDAFGDSQLQAIEAGVAS